MTPDERKAKEILAWVQEDPVRRADRGWDRVNALTTESNVITDAATMIYKLRPGPGRPR